MLLLKPLFESFDFRKGFTELGLHFFTELLVVGNVFVEK